jgi:hypothetical protein
MIMRNTYLIVLASIALVGCSHMHNTYSLVYEMDEVSSVDPDSTVQISMTIDSNNASSSISVSVRMKIINLTNERILWGRGSSNCRIHLKVIEGHDEYSAYIPRTCTMDAGPYYLDPGQSYANSITWTGEVRERDSRSTKSLNPGSYELIGIAGRYRSAPISFTIYGD